MTVDNYIMLGILKALYAGMGPIGTAEHFNRLEGTGLIRREKGQFFITTKGLNAMSEANKALDVIFNRITGPEPQPPQPYIPGFVDTVETTNRRGG